MCALSEGDLARRTTAAPLKGQTMLFEISQLGSFLKPFYLFKRYMQACLSYHKLIHPWMTNMPQVFFFITLPEYGALDNERL